MVRATASRSFPGGAGIGTLTLDNGEMALVSTYDGKVVAPDPSTPAMLAAGLIGLALAVRRNCRGTGVSPESGAVAGDSRKV